MSGKTKRRQHIYKKIALLLIFNILFQAFYIPSAKALTSGPSSPDFSSYEPVTTTSMVDEFTGDFTYNLPVINVPGPDGSDYALSLSYHSGETTESESSWVGYGWSLNPGAINRGKRGFPDDWDGKEVKYYNKVPTNRTVSVANSVGVEALSIKTGLNLYSTIRYNNYKGYSMTTGVGLSVYKGLVNLGYAYTDGDGSYSVNINPAALLSDLSNRQDKVKNTAEYKSSNESSKKSMMSEARSKDQRSTQVRNSIFNSVGKSAFAYGIHSMSEVSMPTHIKEYSGKSFNVSIGVEGNPGPINIGANVGIMGNYTYQATNEFSNTKSFGYMYSKSGENYGGAMMDYSVEKNTPYNKRDRFLSIPFSNADIFSVSGEGVRGGFRMRTNKPGHFRPNSASNSLDIFNIGGQVQLGTAIGVGVETQIGHSEMSINGKWPNEENTEQYKFPTNTDDNYYFRFFNDLGGEEGFGLSSDKERASIIGGDNSLALYGGSFSQLSKNNSIVRSGRSSYIGYHTNREMAQKKNNISFYSADKNESTNKWVKRSDGAIKEGIGEFFIHNPDGNKYVYGLPVYSIAERNLQFGLETLKPGNLENNFMVYHNTEKHINNTSKEKAKVVGEESMSPYASAFLLTEITSPDFVDRNMDGADDNDFGGYTKFDYRQVYGSGTNGEKGIGGDYYNWRVPFKGLYYQKGLLSNPSDDMGMASSGRREVYYLNTIETKTHIAVFVTNKVKNLKIRDKVISARNATERTDALGSASATEVSHSKDFTGSQALERLERIELYAKGSNGTTMKLIKTVNFDYDYSLCKNIPNSRSKGAGKLTLKKVWFEYEGIYNAKISPYIFSYAYSTKKYPSLYQRFENYGLNKIENPDYSVFNTDAWGNYQDKGADRKKNMTTWVDQTPDPSFDPAAWHLKAITLPSGGEIHVQYEQDEYQFVQDRRANVMVSLKNDGTSNQIYNLNVESELGITNREDKEKLAELIRNEYKNNKIYFKFLYALIGDNASLDGCNVEYINGYATLKDSKVDNSGNLYIELQHTDGKYDIPNEVCKNLVQSQYSGRLSDMENCNLAQKGMQLTDDASDNVYKLAKKIGTQLGIQNTCKKINPGLSYFRIPSLNAKKGGGVRVKSLLMYDNGLETGDASLFGKEYLYENLDGSSSGVANNEPSDIREENALVTALVKRSDQSSWNIVISGKDKEQFEGPIGESLLPSPSVGYSRVVVKNIYTGKTGSGHIVSEFFTTKDYPFDKVYDTYEVKGKGFDNTSVLKKEDYSNVNALLANITINNIWATQGYRFVLNDMNGKPKSFGIFPGDYIRGNITSPSTFQEFSYFEPGEKVPVTSDGLTIIDSHPGREVEVVMEKRGVKDIVEDVGLSLDFGVGLLAIFPIPFGSFAPTLSYSEAQLYTHVTSKIISYPAIVKRIRNIQNGIEQISENAAFDIHSGEPVVVKTYDGYHGLDLEKSTAHQGVYHNISIPAVNHYKAMGQKSESERKVLNGTSWFNMKYLDKYIVFDVSDKKASLCNIFDGFNKGDLLRVNIQKSDLSSIIYICYLDEIRENKIFVSPSTIFNPSENIPYASKVLSIEVLQSGKTNQLTAKAGEIITYGAQPTEKVQFIDQTILNERKTLAFQLNNAIKANAIYPPGSFKNRFLNEKGECVLKEISFTSSEDGLTLGDCIIRWHNDSRSLDLATGYFDVDLNNGNILFRNNNSACTPVVMDCLNMCPTKDRTSSLDNVVAASATTYNDKWEYDASSFSLTSNVSNSNPYELGKLGKWRPQSQYVYKENIKGGNLVGTDERNYNSAGTFPLTMFNWKNLKVVDTTKWIRSSTITKYSPHGHAIEENDLNQVKSVAKFSLFHSMPYIVAKNASYESVQFQSFESFKPVSTFNVTLEENLSLPSPSSLDNTTSHSGIQSLKMNKNGFKNLFLKNFILTQALRKSGLSVKVWVKDPSYSESPLSLTIMPDTKFQFTKLGRSGEWVQYEAKINSFNKSIGEQVYLMLSAETTTDIWIDDLKVQPKNASVTCYVYDPFTFRLAATFDDNHFGTFYQYNGEGKLVRKRIETEMGIKTISESQYNFPKQSR